MALGKLRATQLRRRPVKSEGEREERPQQGFFKVHHDHLPQIAVLCKDRAQTLVVLSIMSASNLRALNFENSDGWSGVIQTDELATATTLSSRALNYAIEDLLERGVIQSKTVKQAQRAGLVSTVEAKETKYFGSVLRIPIGSWPALVKSELEAAQEDDEEDEDEEVPVAAESDVRMSEQPVVAVPGRVVAFELSPAARSGLKRCSTIELDCRTDAPFSFDLVASAGALKCVVSETPQSQSQKHTSPPHSKGLSNPVTVPWRADERYMTFVDAYRETGKSIVDEDWEEAYGLWKRLLVGEQVAAVRGVRKRVELGVWNDPVYVPYPKKYLKVDRKREVVAPKNRGIVRDPDAPTQEEIDEMVAKETEELNAIRAKSNEENRRRRLAEKAQA